jgi:hypothetical protein
MSCCRAFHASVSYDNHVILFGGAGANNDVEVFSFNNFEWRVLETVGNAPSGRYSPAATVVGHKMYIFGGVDATTQALLDDLYVLDLQTLYWSEIPSTRWSPKARAGATLSNYLDFGFVLFGGSTNDQFPEYFNDVWIFDTTELFEWHHVTPNPVAGGPSPRALHAAGYIDNIDVSDFEGGIIVYGGITYGDNEHDATYLNDLWIIDPYYWFFPPTWDISEGEWEDPDYQPPFWYQLTFPAGEVTMNIHRSFCSQINIHTLATERTIFFFI